MLTQSAQERLVEYARAHPDQEVCGFVISDGTYRPIRNVADRINREFVFHPYDQMRVVRQVNAEGLSILGVFHSHPGGSDKVSDRDFAGWPILSDGSYCRYWIIVNDEVIEFGVEDDRPVRIT